MGGPRFIQIINNYHVQQEEIRIPQEFVTEYGDDLSDHAVFIVPSGIEWFVEIKRDSNSDGRCVYFKKGLNELFESYSLTSGTFLVLKYEGISQFKVRICQLSGKEVDYSSFHNNDTDVYYIEASDEDGDNDDSEDDSNDEEREEFRDDPVRKKNRSITHGSLRTQERAIEIERGFKSSRNNPFFTIGLQPSYVSHKFLPIPANFEGKEELRKLENIRLDVVPNGGSWIVFLITMGRGQGIRFIKVFLGFLKTTI
ncbi:putative B3 domain-containing protein At5g66980 [Papaver somniferum]|nr:putative B3 domain-containing protein At5g66980 [Papaver somniferum]XP_026388050.1 putative B3 domain-containing protein At5g66980 [Papaver somniferum]